MAPRECRTTLDSGRLNASPVQKDCSTAASASELRRAASGQGFGAFSTEQQQKQLLQVVANLKQLHTAAQAASAPTQGPLAGDSQRVERLGRGPDCWTVDGGTAHVHIGGCLQCSLRGP